MKKYLVVVLCSLETKGTEVKDGGGGVTFMNEERLLLHRLDWNSN